MKQMRLIDNAEVADATALAETNYLTWGQWVIECMTPEEIRADLSKCASLAAWTRLLSRVGDARQEIVDTRW